MRIAILGHGSRGDIQPLLALGMELSRRNHSVALTVNPNLLPWAKQSGLDVQPFPVDSEAYLKSPEGQRMLASGKILELFQHAAQVETDASPTITEACVRAAEGADLVLSTGLTILRGVVLSEKFGTPHQVLSLQPIAPTASFPHFVVPVASLLLPVLNRLSYRLYFDQVWPLALPSTNAMRAALGLRPWTNRVYIERTLESINLFSERLVPPPDDWGERHVVCGFAHLSDEGRERLGEAKLPAGLEPWLDSGSPPVYFGFGSMPILDPSGLLAAIGSLCDRLGLRALIGAGWSDYASTRDDRIFVAPAFDHDRVLPRCRAAVHHGGAGTVHTTLAAELPSLVCSVFADQPFWGRRLQQLGVGLHSPFRKLNAEFLARCLPRLLDASLRGRTRALGAQIRAEDGASRASDVITRAFGRS